MVWVITIGQKHRRQGVVGGPLVDGHLEEAVLQCVLGRQVAYGVFLRLSNHANHYV